MKKRESHSLEEASINLTPLIDVVFVILIMFIVIAPLLEQDRVELASGGTLKQSAQSQSGIVIHVLADDSIYLNQQLVSLDQLQKQLACAKIHSPDVIPQLFHDCKATFGTYQTIKNAVTDAGFVEMDVLLRPSCAQEK